MIPIRNLCYVASSAAMLLAAMPSASAEDKLIVATARHGAWESAAAELGQQAGIFKKHGLVLEFMFTRDNAETEQRVISGSADIGSAVSAMEVMRSYSFGAHLRIISAHMTGSTNYWYVLRSSPIRSVGDIAGKIVGYETNGSSSQYDAIDFMRNFGVNAKLALTGGANATFNHLKAGIIDIGWGSPPFGVDRVAKGDIRIIARANDVPKIRNKTTNVMITNTDTLKERKDVLTRYVQAYREAVEWMYTDPAALQRYAELADVSEGEAQQLRDTFFPKDMLLPGNIVGLNMIAKDAVVLGYLRKRLSRRELRDLVQIATPAPDDPMSCKDISRICPLLVLGP
ncbi:MAG: ABC transporter substrate-binding protein [Rhodoplanes sp.]